MLFLLANIRGPRLDSTVPRNPPMWDNLAPWPKDPAALLVVFDVFVPRR